MALATGCDFITGVPSVTDVDVSVVQASIPVGATTTAVGTAYGKGHKVLQNSRINVGYSSSDPAVATVNPSSGQVTGVSVGTAVITATARDKKDTVSITITPEVPSAINVTPPNVAVGETVTLDIRPVDRNGQPLVGRKLNVTSLNPAVLTVSGSGTTVAKVTGVTVGATSLTIEVDGRTVTQGVTVAPIRPSTFRFGLSKGANTLIEGESNQANLQLFDAAGAPISNTTQSISYASDDQTIATVSNSGIVTGIRAGSTSIRANIVGTTTQPIFTVTVTPLPAKTVTIQNRLPFLRLGSDGVGVPSPRSASAADSIGRTLTGRLITYVSRDPSIFTVNALGTVTARAMGTTWLVASADNGAVADSIRLRVTEVPIVSVTIIPKQQTIFQDSTVQFTVSLLDSLANVVTSNNIQWFTSNSLVLPVTATGLALGKAPGGATITVQVNQVSGLPSVVQDQATITVLPTPVASVEVTPTTIDVQVGRQFNISVIAHAADGRVIVTTNILPRVGDPSIATSTGVTANGQAAITGLKEGKTEITFQALDQTSNPQGTPGKITVNVIP